MENTEFNRSLIGMIIGVIWGILMFIVWSISSELMSEPNTTKNIFGVLLFLSWIIASVIVLAKYKTIINSLLKIIK